MPGPTPPPRIGKFAGATLAPAAPKPVLSGRKPKPTPVTRPPPGLINRKG